MAKKNKGGRPTKKTEKLVSKLIEAFKWDATDEEACRYAGIAPVTYYEWRNTDESFRSEMDRAKDFIAAMAKKNVEKAIKNKDKDMSKWYLERRQKKIYSQRVENTGEDGQPLQINLTKYTGEHTEPTGTEKS